MVKTATYKTFDTVTFIFTGRSVAAFKVLRYFCFTELDNTSAFEALSQRRYEEINLENAVTAINRFENCFPLNPILTLVVGTNLIFSSRDLRKSWVTEHMRIEDFALFLI